MEESSGLLTIENAAEFDEPLSPFEPLKVQQSPLDRYWATSRNPETFLTNLKRRVNRFHDYMDDIGLADRAERSWEMYCGLFWDNGAGPTAVKVAGEEGDIRIAEVNEMRQSLLLLKTYITSHRPEWDTLTMAGPGQSIEATKRGNEILDSLLLDPTNNCEQSLLQSVEDATIVTAGFAWHKWDKKLGRGLFVDPAEKTHYTGDYKWLNPSLVDVSFDHQGGTYENSPWVDARCLENRYDLMAEFPQFMDDIDKIRDAGERQRSRFDLGFNHDMHGDESDFLWVHYTYLKPSCAIPSGRMVRHIGWQFILEDEDELPDGGVPIHRLIPATFMYTPFGYAPAFSCQAPQELLNNVLTAIATNQNAFGMIKIHKQGGDPINRATLEPGITVIETDGKVTPLNLLQSSPELYQSVGMFTQMVRAQTGVNDASRGFSKGEESGAARAFQEQRTQQGSVDFVGNWDRFLASVGTGILRGYAKRLARNNTLPGVQDVRYLHSQPSDGPRGTVEMSAEVLKGIERVAVVRGNPEMRTIAGQMKVAEFLLQSGAATITKEEFVTVAKGGGIQHLTRSEEAELDRVHRENDRIREGIGPKHVADPLDNHMLHMRKHAAEAKSAEAEGNPELKQAYRAATLEHAEMLMHLEMSQLQTALGYNPGPLGAAMGAQPPLKPGQSPPGGSPKKVESPEGEGGPPRLTGGTPKPGNNPPGGNPALAPTG